MTQHDQTLDETQIRIDLAAAIRLSCRNDWHEGVANHFSAAISADGRKFLVNPRWVHWSRVRASDLVLCDADDPSTMERADAPDPSAWSIHSALHRNLPQARVALHIHPPPCDGALRAERPDHLSNRPSDGAIPQTHGL